MCVCDVSGVDGCGTSCNSDDGCRGGHDIMDLVAIVIWLL